MRDPTFERSATPAERASLDATLPPLPDDPERVDALRELLPEGLRSDFVRCQWKSDGCYYCQRPDGEWVLIRC